MLLPFPVLGKSLTFFRVIGLTYHLPLSIFFHLYFFHPSPFLPLAVYLTILHSFTDVFAVNWLSRCCLLDLQDSEVWDVMWSSPNASFWSPISREVLSADCIIAFEYLEITSRYKIQPVWLYSTVTVWFCYLQSLNIFIRTHRLNETMEGCVVITRVGECTLKLLVKL